MRQKLSAGTNHFDDRTELSYGKFAQVGAR